MSENLMNRGIKETDRVLIKIEINPISKENFLTKLCRDKVFFRYHEL